MEEKITLLQEVVCFQMLDFDISKSKSDVSKLNSRKITSEGDVSHNICYYQPLPITRNQVRFYANNYFE